MSTPAEPVPAPDRALLRRLAELFAPMAQSAEQCQCEECRRFLRETEAEFRQWPEVAGRPAVQIDW
jgi:hypothetical protein